MRVALSSFSFVPSVNGVVTVYRRVIEHLSARGHELLYFAPPGCPAQVAGARVVACPGYPIPGAPSYSIAFPPRDFAAQLRAFRPDVYHAIDVFHLSPLGLAALRTAKRLGIPAVAAYHTHYPSYAAARGVPISETLLLELTRIAYEPADLVVTPSRAFVQLLAEHGFGEVAMWGNGVDAQRFRPDRRDDALRVRLTDGHPERPLLIAVGRLDAEKGLHTLRPLLDRLPDAVLVFAGDGPARAPLERAFAGTRARFLGWCGGDELAALYATADALLLPSTTEVQGLVAIEALACGCPVVGAEAGGVAEQIEVGRTGQLYRPGDSEGLLRGVAWALARRDDAATRTACREAALPWSWEAATDGLLALWADLIARRVPPRPVPARRSLAARLVHAYALFAWTVQPIWWHDLVMRTLARIGGGTRR